MYVRDIVVTTKHNNLYFDRKSIAIVPLPRFGQSSHYRSTINKISSSRSLNKQSIEEFFTKSKYDALDESSKKSLKLREEYEWHKLAIKAVSYLDASIKKQDKDMISVAIIKALSQNGEILWSDEETIDTQDILSDAAVIASNLVLNNTNGNKELAIIAAKAILQAGYYTRNKSYSSIKLSKSIKTSKSIESKLSKTSNQSDNKEILKFNSIKLNKSIESKLSKTSNQLDNNSIKGNKSIGSKLSKTSNQSNIIKK